MLVAATLALLILVSPWLPIWGVEFTALSVFAALIALVIERPQRTLFIFILGLPLHTLVMAYLFHRTGNVTFVALMQPWKEVLLSVTLVRIIVPMCIPSQRIKLDTARWPRLTALDLLFALLAVVAGISLLLPHAVIPLIGRLDGFRDLIFPFGLFALGRLAPLARRDLWRVIGLLALDCVVLGLGAIGERLLWGNGLLVAVGYGAYLHAFLAQTFPLPYNTPFDFYTDRYVPRAGSLAMRPLDLATLFLVALPILLTAWTMKHRLGEGRRMIPLLPALFLAGTALVLAWQPISFVLAMLESGLVFVLALPRWQWKGIVTTLVGAALGLTIFFSVSVFVSAAPDNPIKIRIANTGFVFIFGAAEDGTLHLTSLVRPAPRDTAPVHASSVNAQAAPKAHKASAASNNRVRTVGNPATLIAYHPPVDGVATANQIRSRLNTARMGEKTSSLVVSLDPGAIGLLLSLMIVAGGIWVSWRAAYTSLDPIERAIFQGLAIAGSAIALEGILSGVTMSLFAAGFLWWMVGVALTTIQKYTLPPDSAINL
jgi:hypothetical protein